VLLIGVGETAATRFAALFVALLRLLLLLVTVGGFMIGFGGGGGVEEVDVEVEREAFERRAPNTGT